jgi:hypothetical protein
MWYHDIDKIRSYDPAGRTKMGDNMANLLYEKMKRRKQL